MNTRITHLLLIALFVGTTLYPENLAQQYGTAWHRRLHRPRQPRSVGGELQLPIFIYRRNGTRRRDELSFAISYYQNLDVITEGLYALAQLTDAQGKRSKLFSQRYFSYEDLDVLVGMDFYRSETAHASLNVGATFPLHHRHYAVGGGATASCTPWRDTKSEFEVLFALNYRHELSRQSRNLITVRGIENAWRYAIGTIGEVGAPSGGNNQLLWLEVTKHPGNHIDLLLGTSFTTHGWTFDAGYNLVAADEVQARIPRSAWKADTHGFASENYCINRSHLPFRQVDSIGIWHPGKFINYDDLDPWSAGSSFFSKHMAYAGIAYSTKGSRYFRPIQLKLGGTYTFAGSGFSLARWALFLSYTISF